MSDIEHWPECTCSEDRNGGDPYNHAASCPWALAVLPPAAAIAREQEGAVEALRELLAAYDAAYPKGGRRLPGPGMYVATEKARHYLKRRQ